MKRIFLPLVLCAVLWACGGEEPAPVKTDTAAAVKPQKKKSKFEEKKGIVPGVELIKGVNSPYDESVGHSGDSLIVASYKGKVEMSDSLGKHRRLLFDLSTTFILDKVAVAQVPGGKWLVCWQETDLIDVYSYVALYKTGAAGPEWKSAFKASSPGVPVVDGNAAYVTSRGIVARLNMASGEADWRHDSLYNPYKRTFQKFERPIVCADKIVFVDYPIRGRRERRDTLFIHPETGAILK